MEAAGIVWASTPASTLHGKGFRLQVQVGLIYRGLGFRVWDLGFRVWGLGSGRSTAWGLKSSVGSV